MYRSVLARLVSLTLWPVLLQSINDLASALSKVRLDPNTLIRICWPKDLCTLLRDDVVLVDRLILLLLNVTRKHSESSDITKADQFEAACTACLLLL